jgi:deoxyribonuclease (pyrimidine dimer)
MTRINTIDVRFLTDQHLRAEYLEYMFAVDVIYKSFRSRKLDGIPAKYVLGTGHILFFKDKLLYLKNRHERIKEELRHRGFRLNLTLDFRDLPTFLFNDWMPSLEDIITNFDRVFERVMLKPEWYRYYRQEIPAWFTDRELYRDRVTRSYLYEGGIDVS